MSRKTLLLGTTAALLLAATAPASAAFPGANGALTYGWTSSDEPELGPPFRFERAVRTVQPDGTHVRTVVGCTSSESGPLAGYCSIPTYRDPAFSPDGGLIAFDAGPSLALVRPDGSGLQLLPAHGGNDGEPAFSPPGGRIAFSSGPGHTLLVSRLDGSDARVIGGGTQPVWSTRGWIAFTRRGNVWVVRPGGGELRRLTGRRGSSPAWSPDGRRLAFARRDAILVLDLRSRRLQRAVDDTGALSIAWSPDGRRLAWTTFDGALMTARADGSRERQLVFGGSNATQSLAVSGVDWQPLP